MVILFEVMLYKNIIPDIENFQWNDKTILKMKKEDVGRYIG